MRYAGEFGVSVHPAFVVQSVSLVWTIVSLHPRTPLPRLHGWRPDCFWGRAGDDAVIRGARAVDAQVAKPAVGDFEIEAWGAVNAQVAAQLRFGLRPRPRFGWRSEGGANALMT